MGGQDRPKLLAASVVLVLLAASAADRSSRFARPSP